MIDVEREINEVRREVGGRVLEAGEAVIVRLGRSYPTSVEDLWDACTSAERLARWFVPVTGDLRLGGHYQLEGNAGGEVLTCDPPRSFTATWEYDGEVSWIDVRFEADGPGRARFTLEHLSLPGDHWDEFGPAAVGIGWELGLLGLGGHLAGAPLEPAEAAAWTASADGAAFITASGRGWAAAHESSGVPGPRARASADRTVAFYTAPSAD